MSKKGKTPSEDLDDDAREALSEEVLEAVWSSLENVQLDARKRLLIWPPKKELTFEASVKRLQKELTDVPRELIATHLAGWIEMEYLPQGYSEEEMSEFEELTGQWVDELDEQLDRSARKNV